jgi:Helix-turn-helix domain
MQTLSKSGKLADALNAGAQLTAKQIAARFRVANPRDLVYNLRKEGMNITLNTRTNSKGRNVQFYSLA